MKVKCPSCTTILKIEGDVFGMQIRCPKCSLRLQLPDAKAGQQAAEKHETLDLTEAVTRDEIYGTMSLDAIREDGITSHYQPAKRFEHMRRRSSVYRSKYSRKSPEKMIIVAVIILVILAVILIKVLT